MLLGLPHLKMADWGVFIDPNTKLVLEKNCALCGTPDSPVHHRTVYCSLSGAPSRCPVTVGDRWHAGFIHRTLRCATPDSPVVFSPQCRLELAVRATVPGTLDSPVLLTQTVRRQHFFLLLDFT
jgi:hypothetical protein